MLTLNDTADAENSLYIDTASGLLDLVSRLEEAPEIALDTEADSLHHYFEKVCLIQLAAGEENAIVDPLCGMDLSALLALLTRKPLILHGADYDLRMMRMSFGFLPERDVFDTMLAARLLGVRRIRPGLAGGAILRGKAEQGRTEIRLVQAPSFRVPGSVRRRRHPLPPAPGRKVAGRPGKARQDRVAPGNL